MYIQGLTQEVGSGTFLEVLPNIKTVVCYYLYLDSQNSLPGYHRGIMHKTAHVWEHGQPVPSMPHSRSRKQAHILGWG